MSRKIERRLSEFFDKKTEACTGLIERYGKTDPLISSLEYDSRKVMPGVIFFALTGLHTDGHNYIADAVERGAAAVVHEADVSNKKSGVVYIKVKNSRFAMSPIAASFYGFPSRRLIICGVTGTEGKSTSVYLIWQLLRLLGKKAGFFSTVQYSDGGDAQWNPEHLTTPEATVVQQRLWEMAENGCSYAVLEASSHGLSSLTNRLGDVEFDAALFTNIGHEHLEFHGSWEQYRDDKANLFRALSQHGTKETGLTFSPKPFGVVNADDLSAGYFASFIDNKYSFSVNGKDATLILKMIESNAQGNWYNVFIPKENLFFNIRDLLPGAFNAGNVLGALLVVSGLTGLKVQEISKLCPRLIPVRGRMTQINKGQDFEVLVDYAHTPSSFAAIFPPLRKRLSKSGGRIISLFGSAGERDTKKRSEQGKTAAAFSDIIILTDEDPREENPIAILEEIALGVESAETASFKRDKNLFLIPDRPKAIRKAMSLARTGDLVLLLGKGHENSIIYNDRIMPYDEIAEAEKALGFKL